MTLLELALIVSAIWMTSAIVWRIRYEKRRRAE
jgi:hypothetical protein